MTFEDYRSKVAAQAQLQLTIHWMMRTASAVVEPHPSGQRRRDRVLTVWELFLRDNPEAEEWLR
jgi:hypothetical protein